MLKSNVTQTMISIWKFYIKHCLIIKMYNFASNHGHNFWTILIIEDVKKIKFHRKIQI